MLTKSLFALTAGTLLSLTSLNAANSYTSNIREQQTPIRRNLIADNSFDNSSNDKNASSEEANQALVKQIQDTIKNSYRNYNINIRVKDGKVFLTGNVSTDADRSTIEADVKNIAGVKSVSNELEVRGPMAPSPRS